jgi:hypothetical protein
VPAGVTIDGALAFVIDALTAFGKKLFEGRIRHGRIAARAIGQVLIETRIGERRHRWRLEKPGFVQTRFRRAAASRKPERLTLFFHQGADSTLRPKPNLGSIHLELLVLRLPGVSARLGRRHADAARS